jgi:hypothetical protein
MERTACRTGRITHLSLLEPQRFADRVSPTAGALRAIFRIAQWFLPAARQAIAI